MGGMIGEGQLKQKQAWQSNSLGMGMHWAGDGLGSGLMAAIWVAKSAIAMLCSNPVMFCLISTWLREGNSSPS